MKKCAKSCQKKRLTHCLGVEKAARDLAKRYGADEEQAGLAGLLHDYAKKLSDQEFLDLIDRYELDPALKTGVTMSGMGWSGLQDSRRPRIDRSSHSSQY